MAIIHVNDGHGELTDWSLVAQGRKWVIAVGRTGIALIPIGYGLSTKLWHMVLSECIGYGLLGAGNLATQNAAMDDIFSSNPGATARFPLVDCSCTHGRPSDDCGRSGSWRRAGVQSLRGEPVRNPTVLSAPQI